MARMFTEMKVQVICPGFVCFVILPGSGSDIIPSMPTYLRLLLPHSANQFCSTGTQSVLSIDCIWNVKAGKLSRARTYE